MSMFTGGTGTFLGTSDTGSRIALPTAKLGRKYKYALKISTQHCTLADTIFGIGHINGLWSDTKTSCLKSIGEIFLLHI